MKTMIRLSTVALVSVLTACGGGDADVPPNGTDTAAFEPAAPPTSDTAAADVTSGLVDPNAAGRDQLLAVPGMTPAAADALIGGRPYADMRGVDAALAAHMDSTARETAYATLWKPIDLNNAAAEEIELIPGVGPRMRHEFEEYRPYEDIARFRREIGKYVDEAEVARLERYVAIQP